VGQVASAQGYIQKRTAISNPAASPKAESFRVFLLQTTDSFLSSLTTSSGRELVFIDRGLPDYEVLLEAVLTGAGADRSLEVFLLEPDRDGIQQITEILAGQQGITAVHILSHGSPGSLSLGARN